MNYMYLLLEARSERDCMAANASTALLTASSAELYTILPPALPVDVVAVVMEAAAPASVDGVAVVVGCGSESLCVEFMHF